MFAAFDPARGFFDGAGRRFIRRDFNAEESRLLVSRSAWPEAASSHLPGFHAEVGVGAEQAASHRALTCGGRLEHRSRRKDIPAPRRISHRSFEWLDWFELHGEVEYGNTTARLPELLEALRRADKMVRLDDGTYGVLPEEWLRRIARWLEW